MRSSITTNLTKLEPYISKFGERAEYTSSRTVHNIACYEFHSMTRIDLRAAVFQSAVVRIRQYSFEIIRDLRNVN